MTGLVLNLDKLSEGIRVDLEKRVQSTDLPNDINVNLLLDVSGSMASYKDKVIKLLQRVVAVSNVVDDDGILNFNCFSDTFLPEGDIVAAKDFKKIPSIVSKIYSKNGPYWCGTSYTPALEGMLALHADGSPSVTADTGNWIQKLLAMIGSWFGISKKPEQKEGPVGQAKQLVLLITDGENSDKQRTEKFFEENEKNNLFFFQCIGLDCNQRFLHSCATRFKNVGYTEINSKQSDEEVIASLVSDEALRHFGY